MRRYIHRSVPFRGFCTGGSIHGESKLALLSPLVALTKPVDGCCLSAETVAFAEAVIRKFQPEQEQLVKRRLTADYLGDFNPSCRQFVEVSPNTRGPFDPATCPAALVDRKVELTGSASDACMMINGLNSKKLGVRCFMADAEDACTGSAASTVAVLENNFRAARLTLTAEKKDADGAVKAYKLQPVEELATFIFRTPSLHMPLPCATMEGHSVSAFLFHLAVFSHQNGPELLKRSRGPFIYLPKLEGAAEARFVNKVLNFIEEHMKWPQGSIKATVLVETWPTIVELPDVVEALLADKHICGLNAARWDYLASLHKHFGKRVLFPPRDDLVMTPSIHARIRQPHRDSCPSLWHPRDRRNVCLYSLKGRGEEQGCDEERQRRQAA